MGLDATETSKPRQSLYTRPDRYWDPIKYYLEKFQKIREDSSDWAVIGTVSCYVTLWIFITHRLKSVVNIFAFVGSVASYE